MRVSAPPQTPRKQQQLLAPAPGSEWSAPDSQSPMAIATAATIQSILLGTTVIPLQCYCRSWITFAVEVLEACGLKQQFLFCSALSELFTEFKSNKYLNFYSNLNSNLNPQREKMTVNLKKTLSLQRSIVTICRLFSLGVVLFIYSHLFFILYFL